MYSCKHLLEDRIYLISSKSVQNLPIFIKGTEKRRLKRGISEYLNGICEIIHLELRRNAFHMIIKMKNRDAFIKFYKEKYKNKRFEEFFIPVSSHIFGRQMSNLLVSFVKWYNWKNKRKGILIDGRYRRHLIESEKELDIIISGLKDGSFRLFGRKMEKKGRSREKVREKGDLDKISSKKGSNDASESADIDLRGCFEEPFKKSLIPPHLAQKMKIFRIIHPCGPNYN